jgi:integration host factor subunit alpha
LSLGKKDIIKNINTKAQISSNNSFNILNSFIELIKLKTSNADVKISNFGTFYKYESPQRYGRNPKTKEEFIISKRSKLGLKVSQKVKNSIN